VRVCARACAGVCACYERVLICVFVFICARARCLCGFMCACSCVSIGLRLRARVCSERVCAPPRRAVSIARPAPRAFVGSRARGCGSVPPAGHARVGRRCHLDVPHGQRAMGCAIFAHVGGRRRRRHLRHRRQRPHRTLLLQRRVREHRRRCAAGRSPGGGGRRALERVLRGYSSGY
jgi:hypothetical protein